MNIESKLGLAGLIVSAAKEHSENTGEDYVAGDLELVIAELLCAVPPDQLKRVLRNAYVELGEIEEFKFLKKVK